MDNIKIPPEALLAARQAFVNAGTSDDDRDPFAEACLAMLRSWPDVAVKNRYEGLNNTPSHREIILPAPQEKE